ncbi:FAD-linked oxidase-like protein [Schizophyllum amplum]|uniref:D-lactate dehydrogenase (cytochrome) n=1 Tax=Schizophyllum amplum TaxID=97359 RepID=A0A550CUB8_9AGAR|nr:FAD-linked oxidase-like protein [Auriculariopsis ampla]
MLKPPLSSFAPPRAVWGLRASARPCYCTRPPLQRRLSTIQPSSTSSWSSRRTAAVLLSTAIASSTLGYLFAKSTSDSDSDSTLTPKKTTASSTGKQSYGSPEEYKEAIQELRVAFGDELVSTEPDVLLQHGMSPYYYKPGIPHAVVVSPRSTQEVVKIVKIATKYRMPIVPYGGATAIEGHFHGTQPAGICVDLHLMDKVLAVHEADSDVVCQAGAKYMDINNMLKEKGIPLFIPLDPGPGATLGGMLSTGCSGTNAVRYGTAKGEWFLNATVVLPSGEVIKTRRRSRKSSAGFDLTKLFIGAEGTLGIVTEVTIRLAPVLPTTVAVVHFPGLRNATDAVIEAMNQGVGIQCVELLDDLFMYAINKHGASPRKWPEKDTLFFKFQGRTPAAIQDTADAVREVVTKYGGHGFTLAANAQEADEIWADRKNALFSGLALVPGSTGWSTDVCVPVSQLSQLIYETKEDLAQTGLTATVIGHVGDGNFHALMLFRNDDELAIVQDAVHRIIKRAIALDGTCTGEHGVGTGKRKYLIEELGEGTVRLMQTIKDSIDPLNLFNPGKLYPDPPAAQPVQ